MFRCSFCATGRQSGWQRKTPKNGAVERNRAKRILRAGYRAVEPELKTGWLIVLSPREGIREAKSTDIARELRKGFSRLGIFRQGTV